MKAISHDRRIKYIYFFRGDLTFGVHFFEAWANAVRNEGVPMQLVTFLSYPKFIDQKHLVKYYKAKGIKVYLSIFHKHTILLYFFMLCLLNKKIIVHLKKQPAYVFDRLKLIFPNTLKYIVEGEGDPISEIDFLLKHPYKKDFYKKITDSVIDAVRDQQKYIRNADLLTVGTTYFKELLIKRYPNIDLRSKISVVQMSFTKGSLSFSKNIRLKYRELLGFNNKFVIIYIGNAYYSWQNLYRTIQIAQLLDKIVEKPICLVLLIKEKDHPIVNNFIQELNYKGDYILKQVAHSEIINYLNSSDIGVALRHDHSMNKVASSGKILEYLACGLPVMTTFGNGVEQPILVEKRGYGAVLKNMDDDSEIIEKIHPFIDYDHEKRNEMSNWANANLSTESFIGEYISKLKKL